MRWAALAGVIAIFGLLGCEPMDRYRRPPGGDTIEPIPDDPPPTLACDGYCVDTAPATYTGPSTFWRGKASDAPECDDPPHPQGLPGIEGFLLMPSAQVQFVRECRFTPSDTCETEGQVCAPIPDAGFHTCVHHVGKVLCLGPYTTHRDEILVSEGGLSFIFTLCCMATPVPG